MKSKNGKYKKLNTKSAVVFGYFWRYGALALGFVAAILLAVFTRNERYVLFVLAGTMAIVGLEYIIATALEMPHIFVVYADAHHVPSSWQDIYRNETAVAKKEMYKLGGVLLGLGILLAVAETIIIIFG